MSKSESGAVVVRSLKGGSLSATKLMRKGDRLFVRKTCDRQLNREYGFTRWLSQWRRMQESTWRGEGHFPAVMGYGVDPSGHAYFDMEYVQNSVTLLEYIEGLEGERDVRSECRRVARLLHARLLAMHGQGHHAPLSLDLYIEEEVRQRLIDGLRSSPPLRRFAENRIVGLNGIRCTGVAHVMDRLIGDLRFFFQDDLQVATHGNPTLENVLYEPRSGNLTFIDPYLEGCLDSRLLDFAQVLQSAAGRYEAYMRREAVIEGPDVWCPIEASPALSVFADEFVSAIQATMTDRDLVACKLLYVSQFIRMLPYKAVKEPHQAMLFYALASALYFDVQPSVEAFKRGHSLDS